MGSGPQAQGNYRRANLMISEALLHIGLLVVVAKLTEAVLHRLGLVSIIGYTLAGVLLGPVAGIVEPTRDIQLFLSVGVFVLFFLIGIDELDLQGFMATVGGRYFMVGVLSVVIPILASLIVTSDLLPVSFSLGLEFDKALCLAGILSLSSLGVVAKVLADKGLLKELIGLRIFTLVIIAEVASLLVVGVTIGEHEHGLSITGVFGLLIEIVGFAAITWFISAKLLPQVFTLLQRFLNVPELSFGLLLGGLFLVVVGAEEIGLHGSLGALLFGASLSGLPNRMRHDVMPGMRSIAEGLFVPLFFASAGLHLNLSFASLPGQTIAALLFIPMLGKLAGAFICIYAARLDTPLVLTTGLMAKGVAEIALLIVLYETQVISHDVFSLLVLLMLGYILLMPQIIGLAIGKAEVSDPSERPGVVPPAFARRALDGVMVRSVTDRTRTYPGSALPVQSFSDDWVVPNQYDYLVVDEGMPVGVVSLSRLRFLRKDAWANTPLSEVLRRNIPQAWFDEPVDDVLQRMADHSLTVIPVMERESGKFLGTVTSDEVMDLVLLMDEVQGEVQRRQKESG